MAMGVKPCKTLGPGQGALLMLPNITLITRKLFCQSVFSVVGKEILTLKIHTGNGMFQRIIWESRD